MENYFGIYIHWPFCQSLCPYCDFNSHITATIDHEAWQTAYLKELDYWLAHSTGKKVQSVFFGGGTPSLMQPQVVENILGYIHKNWSCAPDMEITLEANPGSVDAEKFSAFCAAGINRISIGLQALDDQALHFLGRKHNQAEALRAVEIAQQFFPRVSGDLIYARPGQKAEAWQSELARALTLGLSHWSLYQLTIEQGTPFFAAVKRGDFTMPDEEQSAELFECTQDIMNTASLPAYEVSNHALAGEESRHNLVYWRYGDYLGIGPGAHGRVTMQGQRCATVGHRAPALWLQRIQDKGTGTHAPQIITARDAFAESLMMGLRLREGLPKVRLEKWGGAAFSQIFPAEILRPFLEEKLLWENATHIGATKNGTLRLSALTKKLLGLAQFSGTNQARQAAG